MERKFDKFLLVDFIHNVDYIIRVGSDPNAYILYRNKHQFGYSYEFFPKENTFKSQDSKRIPYINKELSELVKKRIIKITLRDDCENIR
jgi:hypothetical protein